MSIEQNKRSLAAWSCSRPACGYLLPWPSGDGQFHGPAVVKLD
jgi:hypothetical protein